MRIILIAASINTKAGWGTMAHNHCLALWEKKIPFTVFLPKNAYQAEVPYSTCVRYELPALPPTFCWPSSWAKLLILFCSRVPRFDSDSIIHSLVDFPYAVLAWRWAKKNNLPLVLAGIGTYSVRPFTNIIDRWLFMPAYKGARKILAISKFTAEQMKKVSGYERQIDVVNLPVSAITSDPEDPSILSFLQPEDRLIFNLGPLKNRKGVDILLRSLPLILKNVPNTHLITIDGKDKNYFLRLTEELGMTKNFHILNQCTEQQKAALFRRCDLLALTPRYVQNHHYFEGYGLVYLEAGLYKKPVVAANSGGVADAMRDGVTGILVPENDVVATAAAIIKILKDPRLAQKLGEGNYQLATTRNLDWYISQVLKVYQEIS